jgi:hypothetical protein
MVIAGETDNGDDTLLMLRIQERLRGKIRLWANYSVKNSTEWPFAKESLSSLLTYTPMHIFSHSKASSNSVLLPSKLVIELAALFLLLYFYTPKNISQEIHSWNSNTGLPFASRIMSLTFLQSAICTLTTEREARFMSSQKIKQKNPQAKKKLRSWVQIIPPGPFLSVRKLRH